MKAIIKGMIMETLYEADKDGKGNVVGQKAYFRVYQKGEKSMVDIKKIPPEIAMKYDEGCKVAFEVKIFPWKTEDGTINLSTSFVEDFSDDFNRSAAMSNVPGYASATSTSAGDDKNKK